MADIFASVSATPTPATPATGEAPVVRLNLSPHTTNQLQPYAGQQAVPLTVKQLLPGDLAVLALPNGQTITAQAPRTPLQLGTQFFLQVPASLAQLSNAALVLAARMAAPRAAPQPALPAGSAQALPGPLPALLNLEAALQQNPLLAVLPGTVASARADTTLLLPGPVLLQNALPQAPVQPLQGLTLPVPAPAQQALPAGPAVVQVTGLPAAPGQAQPAMLFAIVPAHTPAPAPVPVLLNAGQALPVGAEIPLTVPAAAPGQAVHQPLAAQVATPVPLTPAPQPVPQPVPLAAPGLVVTLPRPLPQPVAEALAVRVISPPAPVLPLNGQGPQPQAFTQQVLLPDGQTATVATPAPLPMGTMLTARLQPSNPMQLLAQSFTLPPQAPSAPMTPLPQTPVALPVTQAALPAGVPVQAVVQQALPGQQVLLSVVTPAAPAGEPLVAQTPVPLAPGTRLTLELNADGQLLVRQAMPSSALEGPQTVGRFETQWPQLAAAAARLEAQDPKAMESLAARLPQAAALMPGLASYVDALQHQNVHKWLGNEVVTMLRALGVDLTQDLSQLAVLRQPGPDGWQGVIFPYTETPQGQPQQGRFFWKNSQGDDDQPASHNTRFVVEMNLSRLGEVQLDGLLTYPELWLKLRLHPPADISFGADLQNVVQTMLQGFGLTGGLNIERLQAFPIDAARLVPAPATPTIEADL